MSNLSAMVQAIEYIERSLKADIAVADIADAVGYSLYHFCRMFNRVVHHTPYDYLVRRRLSESAHALVSSDRRIIDIAYEYRFNSPETYSRAFKRMLGVTPYQWRRQGRIDRRALLPRLTEAHVEHFNRGDYLRPALVEMGALEVAGLMTVVREDARAIPALWRLLARELERLDDRRPAREHYGVVHYPEGGQDEGVLYLAAVEARSLDVQGAALVTQTLPPRQYARFVHKGVYSRLDLTRDYIYQSWLPRSGKRLAGSFELECHGPAVADWDAADRGHGHCIPIA